MTSLATRLTSSEPKTGTLIAAEFKSDIPSSGTSSIESAIASKADEQLPNLPPASAPPPQQTEQSISSTTQEPSLPATVASTTQDSIATSEATQPLPPTTTTSDNATAPTTQPDYGWLQQAIFRRLEELKRSSHPRVDQSQPLKVLVRAVVSHEGALLDAEVVKSSGLDRIDQEAMALVQRAFPMQLDHTLDRRQIAMRIPITYSRE